MALEARILGLTDYQVVVGISVFRTLAAEGRKAPVEAALALFLSIGSGTPQAHDSGEGEALGPSTQPDQPGAP